MLKDFFIFPPPLALSETSHLHMQCISVRIITASREPWDPSGGDTSQGFTNEDACLEKPSSMKNAPRSLCTQINMKIQAFACINTAHFQVIYMIKAATGCKERKSFLLLKVWGDNCEFSGNINVLKQVCIIQKLHDLNKYVVNLELQPVIVLVYSDDYLFWRSFFLTINRLFWRLFVYSDD